MNKTILGSAIALSMAASTTVEGQKLPGKQPNVIVIYTDDQGSIDLNCYGAKDLQTPNLDALAAKGVRFSQSYAAAPLSSPSRAALLTGCTPQKAGLPGNASSTKGSIGMPSSSITIPEVMKDNGYKTAHIGKWHLGFTPETMPNGQGFDYSYGHMGGCIDNYSHFFYWNGPNRHDLYENGVEVWRDGEYFLDLMHEKATKFVKENREDPFFMYYAINMPHYPVQPTPKWREYYKDLPQPRADYAAFVSTVDEYIGKFLEELDKLGLTENTIIIYQADHGHSAEERNGFGGGDAGVYRGAKHSLFEGGIRVPAIISWGDNLPHGEVRDQMTINVDWLPTIMEFCGIENTYNHFDGKSIVDIIKNDNAKPVHKQFWWKNGVKWAVRDGDWKLMGYPYDPTNKTKLHPKKDAFFLVNLADDISEEVNVASKNPEKLAELKELYLKWEYGSLSDFPQERAKKNHKAKGKPIELITKPAKKYSTGNVLDGWNGSIFYNDGNWLGYKAENMEVVIDLGKKTKVTNYCVTALYNDEAWIFSPEWVDVFGSNDGERFKKITRILTNQNPKKFSKEIIEFKAKKRSKYRFFKIVVKNSEKCPQWHQGKGGDAWMFIDEIVID